MFLISAHQTYLNNKLLKGRLSSGNHNNNYNNLRKGQTVNETTTSDIEKIFASFYLFNSENLNIHHRLNLVTPITTRYLDRLMTTNQDIQIESRLMHRTKKYFSSDGHKFLFNNT